MDRLPAELLCIIGTYLEAEDVKTSRAASRCLNYALQPRFGKLFFEERSYPMSTLGIRTFAAVANQTELVKHFKNIVFVRTLRRLPPTVISLLDKVFETLAKLRLQLSIGVRHVEDHKRSPKQASDALMKSRQLLITILCQVAQNHLELKEVLMDKEGVGLERPVYRDGPKSPTWLFLPASAVDEDVLPYKVRVRFIEKSTKAIGPYLPTARYFQHDTIVGENLSLWHLPTLPFPTTTLNSFTLKDCDISEATLLDVLERSSMKKINLSHVHLYDADEDGHLAPGSWVEFLEVARATQLESCELNELFSGEDDLLRATRPGLKAHGGDYIEILLDDLLADVEAAQH